MTKAKVREKYRGLSPQELIDKAYELGFNFENKSFSCSQSGIAALHELLDIDDTLVKAATCLSGGTAEQFMGSCGALVGGLMVIGSLIGRPVEKMSYEKEIKSNVDALFASETSTRVTVAIRTPDNTPIIHVQWEGAEEYSNRPADTLEVIDPDILESAGQAISNALMTLGREVNY